METLSVEQYKKVKLRELQELENKVASLSELKIVLDDIWFERVRAVINSLDNRPKIDDGAYGLFNILLCDLDPTVLNSRLVKIEAVSREQKRLRAYRKSRGELASVQANQIRGSIFEVNIVYAALQSCPSVEVFPKAGKGGSDVEARLIIENRPIYIEAKALGYSKHDVGAIYRGSNKPMTGSHSVPSMIMQIYDALNEKLARDKQLHTVSANNPTVVFLSLGFNADKHSSAWGIESYCQERHSNVSSIFVFDSAFCRGPMRSFRNNMSTLPLSGKEATFFEGPFHSKLMHENGT